MSNKLCPIMYSESLYENRQDILDILQSRFSVEWRPPNKSTRNSLLSALFDKFRIVGKPIKHTGYIMINISQAFLLDRGRPKTCLACMLGQKRTLLQEYRYVQIFTAGYLLTFYLQNRHARTLAFLCGCFILEELISFIIPFVINFWREIVVKIPKF